MGDSNGRVGLRSSHLKTYLGLHSDTTTNCNYNGEQLFGICAEYGLWITSMVYIHRSSQTQTWYKLNDLNTPSHIDFILTRMEHRRNVTDANAILNAGLDTDHRPVILCDRTPRSKMKVSKEEIHLRKLQRKISGRKWR